MITPAKLKEFQRQHYSQRLAEALAKSNGEPTQEVAVLRTINHNHQKPDTHDISVSRIVTTSNCFGSDSNNIHPKIYEA